MSDFPPWGKIQGVSSKKGLFYKTTSFFDEFFISSPYMIDNYYRGTIGSTVLKQI